MASRAPASRQGGRGRGGGAGPDPKACAACGREITWRKAWERDWESVRWCSDACRRSRRTVAPGGEGERLEAAVRELLTRRRTTGGARATACPSEVARGLAPEDWRPLMEPVRAAARRLAARGEVEWLQDGHLVDPSHARGAVRLRLLEGGAHDAPEGSPEVCR